jgi:hypothetical protein
VLRLRRRLAVLEVPVSPVFSLSVAT